MDSSIDHTSCERVGTSPQRLSKIGLTVHLGVWGVCLTSALAASFVLIPSAPAPGQTVRSAFLAATVVAYLVVFFHCFLRLIYSRWSSWLLFTVGFGMLAVSGVSGVLADTHFGHDSLVRGHLTTLRTIMLPAAAVVLLCAAYASRARAVGHRIGTWKNRLKMAFVLGLAVVACKLGVYEAIFRIVSASSGNIIFAADASSSAALLILVFRARRLAASNHDEIVVPVAYWGVAVLLGRVLMLVSWWTDWNLLWWQMSALELLGIAALLLGLGMSNEHAQREASEKMSDLQAMQQISWSLVGAAGLFELAFTFIRSMADNFHATIAAIYLSGEEEGTMTIAATWGVEDHIVTRGKVCSLKPDRRPGFHCGHTARAYVSGEIQQVSEIFFDVEFMPWRRVAQEEGLVISVPLPYRDRIIGVVNLFIPSGKRMSDSQIELLRTIAAAVSPAIENARMRTVLCDSVSNAA